MGLLTCYFKKWIYYRIFRGYVARNVDKKLLRDERERLEDERKAAVEIQRYNLDCYSYTQEDKKKLLYTYGFKGDNFQICCILFWHHRRYRGHLIRKKEIYQQTGLKKEHLEWASDFKQIKNENEARRQKKMEALSEK